LLASVPVPDPAARRNAELIGSEPPRNVERPFGCVFRARCPFAVAECAAEMPALRELERGHAAACLRTDVGRRANAGDAGDRKAFDG
jgi:oligopeptide/dipeptide ABC transporter ATP-binding protein